MKIALAQMRVRSGYLDQNIAEIKRMIDEAKKQNAELIIFPEMCVTGYLISDRYLQDGFLCEANEANEIIKSYSQDIGVIWGNIGRNDTRKNRDGRFERTNQAYFAYNKSWVYSSTHEHYIKHCLPDYRIFDDSRYFKSGIELSLENKWDETALIEPILFKGKRIGLEICEDLWSKDYRVDPTDVYISKGVDFIVNISSSPWTLNKENSRNKRILEHVSKQKDKMVKIIYVNAVGAQNNGKNLMLFDGGSTVFDVDGSMISGCNDAFEPELKIIDLKQKETITPTQHKLMKGLVSGIRSFDEEVLGKRKWIIGLSGGIDSSVNAALLVMALGKDNVCGFNMASQYNSLQTKNAAKHLAHKLDIQYVEGSIESLVKSTHETLGLYGFETDESGLNAENIQARLRGHLLSSFASMHRGVICNNGNKVELALGYATLYGDTIGALSPMGDLVKVQIFELAKEINDFFKEEIIPTILIPYFANGKYVFECAPSAELKDAQIDPMKWGYHDYLVQYFMQYPSHSLSEWLSVYESGAVKSLPVYETMMAYGLDKPKLFIEDLRWFMKAFHFGIFKRIQFPPIIALSRASFGYDYRESQIPYLEDDKVKAQIERILKGMAADEQL